VLEGQKMELKENSEPKKPLSPLRPAPPKTEKPSIKRGRKRKGARSSDKDNSDTDSGLNISFTTYRGNSDGENHMSFEEIGLIVHVDVPLFLFGLFSYISSNSFEAFFSAMVIPP
jgi:hypothetical protein